MKKTFLSLLFTIIVLTSCQEVVTIDLEEGPKRLVVEGRLEKIKGRDSGYQWIRLSSTAPYFSNTETPRVPDAVVYVRDENGDTYEFNHSETHPGLYETWSLEPQLNQRYTLVIEHDGYVYEASERVLPVAPIDSIYQYYVEESLFDEEGIRVRIDFTDPASVENYYLWEQLRDGESMIEPNPGTKWSLIASDEFYDGQTVFGRQPNDELIYETGQTALIRQIALSRQAYDYYFLMLDQVSSGGPFSTPPVTIRGNIENITNPEQYPLGYFIAGEVDEAELEIR